MLKNISRKAKSLLHDGPLSSEVEMKYVSDNRQKMMKIIEGENEKSWTGFPGLGVQRTILTGCPVWRHLKPDRFMDYRLFSKTISHAHYIIGNIREKLSNRHFKCVGWHSSTGIIDVMTSSKLTMTSLALMSHDFCHSLKDLRSHNYEKYHFKVEELSGGMKTPGLSSPSHPPVASGLSSIFGPSVELWRRICHRTSSSNPARWNWRI